MTGEPWRKQLPVQHAVQDLHEIATQMHDGLLMLLSEEPFSRMRYMHLMSLGGAALKITLDSLDEELVQLIKSNWMREDNNAEHDE